MADAPPTLEARALAAATPMESLRFLVDVDTLSNGALEDDSKNSPATDIVGEKVHFHFRLFFLFCFYLCNVLPSLLTINYTYTYRIHSASMIVWSLKQTSGLQIKIRKYFGASILRNLYDVFAKR